MAALESIAQLADRHGEFGVGFRKAWMQTQGAAPVWYLPRGSAVQEEFFRTVRDLAFRTQPDPEHPIWGITPFVDYPRDAGPIDGAPPYDWRWEREWRVRGDLEFQDSDLAILFAPEDRHSLLTDWWKQEVIEGWAGYIPPIVDTRWPGERQDATIRSGPQLIEIEVLQPRESWASDDLSDARPDDVSTVWEDEREHFQAEIREELNGWLDEMARDDI